MSFGQAEFDASRKRHAEWQQSRALEKLAVGTHVRISGVNSRRELNGLTGVVVEVDAWCGRCNVRIDGHGDSSLKYSCLAPIDPAEDELVLSLEQLGLTPSTPDRGPDLGPGPERWTADADAQEALTRYRKRLHCFCKVIEARFDAQSIDGLRAWWAAVPDPRPAAAAAAASDVPTTLADVLPVIAEVRGASLQALRWRVSRGTSHAAHEALPLVRALALSQLNPANAHVLALFCTGVTALDLGLGAFGFERGSISCAGMGDAHGWRDGQLRTARTEWLKMHADALLRLFGRHVHEAFDGTNLTWTEQKELHDEFEEQEPQGFFDENMGVWLRYEDDAYDPEAWELAAATVPRRGLSDSGLAHLSGLRKLTLTGCQVISDAGVCALLRRCPELVELSLSECTGVTDATLRTVAASCPRLRALSVSRCIPASDRPAAYGPELTAEGVLALTHGCPDLAQLTMQGHRQLARDARLAACERELRARGVEVDLRVQNDDEYGEYGEEGEEGLEYDEDDFSEDEFDEHGIE